MTHSYALVSVSSRCAGGQRIDNILTRRDYLVRDFKGLKRHGSLNLSYAVTFCICCMTWTASWSCWLGQIEKNNDCLLYVSF
jgi:hypothetical protein